MMGKKSEPVLITMSVLAGLHLFFGGLAGITALQGILWIAALGALGNLAVAAAQVGMAFYVRGKVTPEEDAQHRELEAFTRGQQNAATAARRVDLEPPDVA